MSPELSSEAPRPSPHAAKKWENFCQAIDAIPMNDLPKHVVADLIQIGRESEQDARCLQHRFVGLTSFDYVNRLFYTAWDEATRTLSTDELVWLIKGLTLSEAALHWAGGSVAGCIFVFRELQRRGDSERIAAAAQWVFEHRANRYLPFGSTRYVSYEDYLWQTSEAYAELRRERRVRHEDHERMQQLEACQRRKQAAVDAEQHAARSRSKAELRRQRLADLAKASSIERLDLILNADATVDYYPEEWANVPDDLLMTLSAEMRNALVKRLRQARGATWKALKRRLVELGTCEG